jgi:hypothetical protein
MKKIAGLVLAASLALGVLTVARPAAAEEAGLDDGLTVTIYYNDVQDEIIDIDLNNGHGITYNTDTGDIQHWEQDENGDWSEVDAPQIPPLVVEPSDEYTAQFEEGGE